MTQARHTTDPTGLRSAWALLLVASLAPAACDTDPAADEEFSDEAFFENEGEQFDAGVESEALDEIADGDEDPDAERPFDPDSDLSVGEAEPLAIDATGYAYSGGPAVDLGPAAGRTCFLQGVAGQISAPQFTSIREQARVEVYKAGGHWWLHTQAGDGAGARGYATCIATDNNQRFLHWEAYAASESAGNNKTFIERNALTRCFLTEVHGNTGWSSPNSSVRLWKDTHWERGVATPVWSFQGVLVQNQDGSSGGGARAVCVDVFNASGDFSWETVNDHPGATASLTPYAGRVCGLHRIQGNFANDSNGWTDGARLYPEDGWWKLFSSNGKGIHGECLYDVSLPPPLPLPLP